MPRESLGSRTPAAATLRRLRLAAGLSQEELAERCQVSARTIRSLESGNAKRPHRETLSAVADALGLSAEAHPAFVASWRSDHRALEELFVGRTPQEAVERDLTRQRAGIRELAVGMTLEVGADRRWVTTTMRRTFEVICDELDHFQWMTSYDVPVIDPDLLVNSRCVNVEVVAELPLPDSGAKAFIGSLGRTLHRGDLCSIEYATDYAAAYTSDERGAFDDEMLFLAQSSIPLLVCEARFAPGAVPASVRQVRQSSIEGPTDVVRDIPIGSTDVAQAVLSPMPSGVHGMRWNWDDSDTTA